MKKATRWLASRLIANHHNIDDPAIRTRYGILEGIVSILINTLLFAVKLFFGLSVQSTALIADAIHTLGDSATSVIVIIGFILAGKPSDKEHPFGHGQLEQVMTLIIAVLLFVAGFELMKHAIGKITAPSVSEADIAIIVIISGTIVLKELLARFSYELGDIIQSDALKADALHHRTDVFATAMVVVALIASCFGYTYLDGIMGIVVSLVIFYSAWEIAKSAIDPLLGEAPSSGVLRKIEALSLSVNGVEGVHDIIFHQYGRTIVISLHIEVSEDRPVGELHDLSEQVEEKLSRQFKAMVVVHIDPINKNHPRYPAIECFLSQTISQDGRLDSFHDLRIVGDAMDTCNVIFELALSGQATESDHSDITACLEEKFFQTFPTMKLVIKIDPKYSYNL